MWDPLERDAPRTGLPDHRLRRVRHRRTRHRGSSRCGRTASPARPRTSWTSLGLPDAHVLGVSFGGGVAQELALRNPHRVRRLVLASTTCGLGGVPGTPAGARPARHAAALLLAALPAGDRRAGCTGRSPTPTAGSCTSSSRARRSRPPTLWGYARPALRDRRLDEPSVAAPHHAHRRSSSPAPGTRSCRRSTRGSSAPASPTRPCTSCPMPGTCCSWITPSSAPT